MSEIVVKLTGDNSDFRGMLDESTKSAGEFGAKITEKLADKVFGLRDISHTVATALGLNLENIAENIARVITGVSKVEEEAYKKSGELSNQITELTIKNMRARLAEEDQLTLLLQDRDRLQKVLDTTTITSGVTQLKVAEARIALEQKLAEINTIQAKQAEEAKKREEERLKTIDESFKAGVQQSEKTFQAWVKTADTLSAIALLEDRIQITEALINSGVTNGTIIAEKRKTIEEDKLQLIGLQAKAEAEAAKAADEEEAYQASLLAYKRKLKGEMADEGLEHAALLMKAEQGLTVQEQTRLDIIEGKTTAELETQRVIEETARFVAGTATPAEIEHLRALTGQTEQVKEQLAVKEKYVALQRVGAGYEQQSTEELKLDLENLKQQLAAVNLNNASLAGQGSGRDGSAAFLQDEINKITKILNPNALVTNPYATNGAGQNINSGSSLAVVSAQQAQSQVMANILATISAQLNGAGLSAPAVAVNQNAAANWGPHSVKLPDGSTTIQYY